MQLRDGRRWLAAIGLCLLGVGLAVAAEPKDDAIAREMKRQRKEAAQRHRRIIMNNDGNDARAASDEPRTHENFLSKRTSSLADTQVDAIFYCSGRFNIYSHHSPESELRTHGNMNALDWAWELGEKGTDSLATIVDFGHKHKMEVFWSMRMNDTHDFNDPSELSRWKQEHPECLMGKLGDRFVAGGNRWSALNYETPEVRDKVVRIQRDVATRYDVDGLEFDFMRSPVYFKPQMLGKPVTQEQRDLMTDMLRRVREMADQTAAKRGRPMLIAVRVPDSIEYAAAIGLDVVRWLKDDLVDLIAVGCFYQLNPWETSVNLGHQYGVPVYPSLSEPRFKNKESQLVRASLECYRGRALDAWIAGADGIYMFNCFNPHSPLWKELGDREALQTMDRLYPAGAMATNWVGYWLAGGLKWFNLPTPLPEKPLQLIHGGAATIPIRVGAAVASKPGLTPTVKVRLLLDNVAKANTLVVKLNGETLTHGTPTGKWVEYTANPLAVKQGVNHLGLSVPPSGNDTEVSDAAVLIRYTPVTATKTKAELSVEDFDVSGPLGSADAKIEKVGENHFKVALGYAPKHPDWPNVLQFRIVRHAKGNKLRLDACAPVAKEDYDFRKYFCSWSYDGQNWQPIEWQTLAGESTLIFPEFTEDRVVVGHQVPMSADDIETLIGRWRQHPCVNIRELGRSVQGRPIYRVSITDPTEQPSPANRWCHYFANQHPGEHNSQWRMVGMIDWLLSDKADDARRRQIHHFVLMMYPDAPSHGWYRVGADGVDGNRTYLACGANAEQQPIEAYAVQRDLEDLMRSAAPVTSFWSMHSWAGIVEPFLLPGPEMDGALGPWNELKELIAKHDNDVEPLVKPLKVFRNPNDPRISRPGMWHKEVHEQFGITSVLCEGSGSLVTKDANLRSGRVLIKAIVDYYKGMKAPDASKPLSSPRPGGDQARLLETAE